MQYSNKLIGLKLKEIREEHLDWSVQKAAKVSEEKYKQGIITKKFTAGQVSDWENAVKGLPTWRLAEALEVYGISLAHFFELIEGQRVTVDITDLLPKYKQRVWDQVNEYREFSKMIEKNPKEETEYKPSDPQKKPKDQRRSAAS